MTTAKSPLPLYLLKRGLNHTKIGFWCSISTLVFKTVEHNLLMNNPLFSKEGEGDLAVLFPKKLVYLVILLLIFFHRFSRFLLLHFLHLHCHINTFFYRFTTRIIFRNQLQHHSPRHRCHFVIFLFESTKC